MLRRLLSEVLGWRKTAAGPAPRSARSAAAPGDLKAGLHAGLALEESGDLAGALEYYRVCAAAHPQAVNARLAMANALSGLWRMDEALAAYAEALRLAPGDAAMLSDFLLLKHLATSPDASELCALHREYGRMMSETVRARTGHPNLADRDKRLKVGYVSRNFSRHSVGYFIEPVIACHDRSRHAIYCYYTHPHADDTTQRIAGLVDGWRHGEGSDDELAARIADDGIDVLVDLGGHTEGNRMGVFARRPAPVQVTWLGYPDTTGLATMDWRISDDRADPSPRADALHTERLLRLAPPFLCYQPPADSPAVNLRGGSEVTFASFNTLVKVNARTVTAWARILQAVPRSRLVLKSNLLGNGQARRAVHDAFAAHAIANERIDLRRWTSDRVDHLGAYGEIDIALDTFPYNGTTTTCEALWMGVPVVTLAGDVHMSRVGVSLLGAVGLEALACDGVDAYVNAAIELALDAERRADLRATMRARLLSSPLLDHAAFTRRLEAGFRQAWGAWCAARLGRPG